MSDYQRLLVTTDFSEPSLAGVREAARLAEKLRAAVTLLYVVEDRLPPIIIEAGDRWQKTLEEHRATALPRLEEYAEEHFGGVDTAVEVRIGSPWETVVAVAGEIDADLIVMASHGYGLIGQLVLGSTTERVLRQASCPVVVVRFDSKEE